MINSITILPDHVQTIICHLVTFWALAVFTVSETFFFSALCNGGENHAACKPLKASEALSNIVPKPPLLYDTIGTTRLLFLFRRCNQIKTGEECVLAFIILFSTAVNNHAN